MQQNKSMQQSKPMASIARKINRDWWFRKFWSCVFLDIFLIAALIAAFAIHYLQQLPDGAVIEHWRLSTDEGIRNLTLILGLESGKILSYSYTEIFSYAIYPFAFLWFIQFFSLLGGLFQTSRIRRRLKPLNDLAVQAQKMSELSSNPGKIRELARAIENVSPDNDDVSIYTGDKDLQSIEIALNHLLHGLKESEKRQMRFVDDASHELRTPIAVIQGYIEMLDRWGKSDEAVLDESIEAIKNESLQMKTLVEQLLFLARGDNGRAKMSQDKVDLCRLMEEVFEESEMIDHEHSYHFQPDQVPYITGDSAMLKQSIRIFAQNAEKYSEKGSQISFKVGCDSESVWYMIQDEGCGIDERDISHIFERFYRADAARNSKTGGSGLGLSIAKWIVDAHNGTIEVVSRPEIGTRFKISFQNTIKHYI